MLLVSVCLPHLLQKLLSYSENKITKDQIASVVEKLSLDPSSPIHIHDTLTDWASELVVVANTRYIFDSNSTQFNDVRVRTERVRLRLLGALVHLAVRISLDQSVEPKIPAAIEVSSWPDRAKWWRQAYIRSASVESQRLRLYFTLPKGQTDTYAPLLVDPLDEQIKQLVEELDFIFLSADITLVHQRAHVDESEVALIPSADWQLLKFDIEKEQAYRSQDRLQQDAFRAQRLRDILVAAEVAQAESMLTEGRLIEAAGSFALAADLLAKSHEIYQARHYAVRSAETYLQANERPKAARQYLHSAEVWLESALTPQLVTEQLERANQLAVELGDPYFRVTVLIAEARLAFAALRDNDAQRALQEARQLIVTLPDAAEKARLYQAVTLLHSLLAMVWEEWDVARQVIEDGLSSVILGGTGQQLDLQQRLMQIGTETGDWGKVDAAYQEALQLLSYVNKPNSRGLLTMHFAASLARRGSLIEALASYKLAIQQLQDVADSYTIGVVYQNMQHLLIRNGLWSYESLWQDQLRRLDLFNATSNQNIGYKYEQKALSELLSQDYRNALQNIRLAMWHYWHEGDWAGIETTFKLSAELNAPLHVNKPVESLAYAIRASDEKLVEQCSQTLLEHNTSVLVFEAFTVLTTARPNLAEQIASVKAIGILADVTPTGQLDTVLHRLVDILQGPEENKLQTKARRYAAEALTEIMEQLDRDQTTYVLQVAQSELRRQQYWTVTDELLKLLEEAFIQKRSKVIDELYDLLVDAALSIPVESHLRDQALRVAVHACRTAPDAVRQRVVNVLSHHPSRFERLRYLTYLHEPISEIELREVVEEILQAINPQPRVVGTTIEIGIPAVGARMLSVFNEILPNELRDRIISGLLLSIINEHAGMGIRSESIWALSDLPTEFLTGRTDGIIDTLILGAGGSLPRSASVERDIASQTDPYTSFRIDFGNVDQVRQSSLHALGKIYCHVDSKHRERIVSQLIVASRDSSPMVRQGAAMGLGAIESDAPLPTRLLLALVALIHDADVKPCAWACVAAGKLIERRLTAPLTNDLVERLVYFVNNTRLVQVRVGAAVALRTIADSVQLDLDVMSQIAGALNILSADVSYRVRANSRVEQ